MDNPTSVVEHYELETLTPEEQHAIQEAQLSIKKSIADFEDILRDDVIDAIGYAPARPSSYSQRYHELVEEYGIRFALTANQYVMENQDALPDGVSLIFTGRIDYENGPERIIVYNNKPVHSEWNAVIENRHLLDEPLAELMHGEELEESLMHFGVKGMKWGVRRDKRKTTNKNQTSSTGNRTTYDRKESIKNLSDDELRKRINRLNMESQYRNLTLSKKERGKKEAEAMLEQVGKQLAKDYATKTAKSVINTAIKTAIGQVEKGDILKEVGAGIVEKKKKKR